MKAIFGLISSAVLTAFSASAVAWTISSGFEEGTVGEEVSIFGSSKTFFTDAHSHRGDQSALMSVEEGATGFGFWGGIIGHPEDVGRYDEIWFRVKTYFPQDFDFTAQPWLKFLRVHTVDPSGDGLGHNDWYIFGENYEQPFGFIYEGQQQWRRFGTQDAAIVRGNWEAYEIYIKFDSVPKNEGGEAIVRTWKNGQLLGEFEDVITLKTNDAVSERSHIFTYWNGGAPATQHMYVDDVMLTTDTPYARDAHGNPMIGPGGVSSSPRPPTDIQVE